MRLALPLVLFSATFSLALGVVLPLIRVDRLYFFTDQPSLVAMISGLWTEGDCLLASIIAMFSIIFPCMKLGLLHGIAYGGDSSVLGVPGWIRAMSKWSMLDVVLVALVIFAAKTSGLAKAFTMPGLWFFAASAILTAVASQMVGKSHSPA